MRIAFTHNLQRTNRPEEAEFDTPATVRLIEGALLELGHEVLLVDVLGDLPAVIARLCAFRPNLIFNTAEGTKGRFREALYPALFESLGIPYTGSDAYACAVTLDKHLSKLILSRHGVETPRWAFVDGQPALDGHDLRFPIIVKPNFEGSSRGITQENVVESPQALQARVAGLHAEFPEGIIAEEYIPGVDATVVFLEAASPETEGILQPCRYEINDGTRRYPIYDFELKQYLDDKVHVRVADGLPPETKRELITTSSLICRTLRVRDVARIDYRLGDDGRVYFIEINALPSLQVGASVYLAGARHGLVTETQVIGKVLESACQRFSVPL
jgi:D-alanine-D-alanine ligase